MKKNNCSPSCPATGGEEITLRTNDSAPLRGGDGPIEEAAVATEITGMRKRGQYSKVGSVPACSQSLSIMQTMDYRTMAEEWLEHVTQQYEMTHICRKDLPLIEHLLKSGFTVIARRDSLKVLHVDFIGRKHVRARARRH